MWNFLCHLFPLLYDVVWYGAKKGTDPSSFSSSIWESIFTIGISFKYSHLSSYGYSSMWNHYRCFAIIRPLVVLYPCCSDILHLNIVSDRFIIVNIKMNNLQRQFFLIGHFCYIFLFLKVAHRIMCIIPQLAKMKAASKAVPPGIRVTSATFGSWIFIPTIEM